MILVNETMKAITQADIPYLLFSPCMKKPIIVYAIQMNYAFYVETKEGNMYGSKEDYLIMGVERELYPCKKDIFEKTYEFMNNGHYMSADTWPLEMHVKKEEEKAITKDSWMSEAGTFIKFKNVYSMSCVDVGIDENEKLISIISLENGEKINLEGGIRESFLKAFRVWIDSK